MMNRQRLYSASSDRLLLLLLLLLLFLLLLLTELLNLVRAREEGEREDQSQRGERVMERRVEVWKQLLKIFCLMFRVAPTSDHSTFSSSAQHWFHLDPVH